MVIRIALVTEILATIVCLHCIYDRKFKVNIKTICLTMTVLIILELINYLQLSGIFSFGAYAFLIIYCKIEFKSPVVETLISFVICMILLTVLQFMCLFFTGMIEEYIRDAVSNVIVLGVCTLIFPKCNLHRLRKSIYSRRKFIFIILSFVFIVVIIMLLQGKALYKVKGDYFIFVIPSIAMLLYLNVKWYTAQIQVEKMHKEICEVSKSVKIYEELLIKVRLRQHEFKNHLAAIFSSHYTHKTYEKLVQAQEKYCQKMSEENKYNGLLFVGDNVFAGYLYGKFQEIEAEGIEVAYQINAMVNNCSVPIYHVIEMLGILLDNAVEALKDSEDRQISFEVMEIEDGYQFVIKNPFDYVPYEELVKWFQFEKSERGSGRGLGLYHLKCLCEEWKCEIGCKNIEFQGKNWIIFLLIVGKAGSKL